MITPELKSYIQASLKQGKSVEEIKSVLRAQGGWTEQDLSEAFAGTAKSSGLLWKILVSVLIVAVGGYFLYVINGTIKRYDGGKGDFPQIPTIITETEDSSTHTDPCISGGSFPCSDLIKKYSDLKTKYNLKYQTIEEAMNAIKAKTGVDNIPFTSEIDFYLPGQKYKDNNPYYHFYTTVDASKNDCLIGDIDLVSGEIESIREACEIYD